jgi:pimeloyl-ACP methyl ester carboxylesterase
LATSAILAAVALAGCGAVVDRRASAREAAAEAAYPATGQFVTVNGIPVHAEVAGQGRDLVLIHGASGNTRDFTFALMQDLARSYRVTAFDRPGLGWSAPIGPDDRSPLVQAALLRAAAEQMGLRDPIVLGHSYGASVAMAWALTAPPDAATAPAALVIVSGATMPWPGGLGPWYRLTGSRLGQAAVIPAITAFAGPAQTEGTIAAIFAPDPVPPGYSAHVGAALTLRRDTLRANARQVNGLKSHLQLMAPRYPRLSLPVEILHGTADTIVPASVHAIPLSNTLPASRLTLIPGAGHMPHHAHADAVIDAIDRAAARSATERSP